ncbi:MAG: protein-ADP-ribose hydrolase [Clostridiaceae bacterium]|nr:protein-ADP-ribose hydrolase [Clostridiaceae bacterium]
MNQNERRKYLIKYLKTENSKYSELQIPENEDEQKYLLRGLLNVRMANDIAPDFLQIQNEYLTEELNQKTVTDYKNLHAHKPDIYLWQGDITTLKCDAIVNAANSQMLGCFCPNHKCIDNAIHTYAGVQLRMECADIMKKQGSSEPTGSAKITSAYNLPCKYVLHTVGPIIYGTLTKQDKLLLASCYRSCLELAEQNSIKSVAFCCISTGEFHFPNDEAAKIAIQTVNDYKQETGSRIEVIFNVFKDYDYEIYRKLLG